jgi:hypothetical protein
MYQLYIDKKEYKLKVEKLRKSFQSYGPLIAFAHTSKEDDIYDYNENYKMCKDRKVLVQLAREIKNLWLAEAMTVVQQIEGIKI